VIARLVVEMLIEPGADVVVALDDSVCVRTGPKVHGAGWQHDGSAKNLQKLSYGNCFVTVGIVAQLPFCSRTWCLLVLDRLHLPGKNAGPSKVTVAAQLVARLATAFGDRWLHVVADAGLVTRYAMRWSCEQSYTEARNVLGAGEGRNRTRLAAERTVPFGMLVHTLIVVWYVRHGYDQADIDARRADQPWYGDKTEPAFEDMLIKLRRTSSPPIFRRQSSSAHHRRNPRRHLSLGGSSGLITKICESRACSWASWPR
jgi:hypothetical protein